LGSTLLVNLVVWFLLSAPGGLPAQAPSHAAQAASQGETTTRSPHGNL